TDVKQLVQVSLAALTTLKPLQELADPEAALAARCALAARLMLVELDPAQHDPHHAGGVVEQLDRAGAEHGPGGSDVLIVQRDVQVLVGEWRRGRPAGSPELEPVPGPYPAGQLQQLAQRGAERCLVLAGRGDMAGQREQPESLGLLGAEAG